MNDRSWHVERGSALAWPDVRRRARCPVVLFPPGIIAHAVWL